MRRPMAPMQAYYVVHLPPAPPALEPALMMDGHGNYGAPVLRNAN